MQQLNTSQPPEAEKPFRPVFGPNSNLVLDCMRAHRERIRAEERLREMIDIDVRCIDNQAAMELSIQQMLTDHYRANAHLYRFSAREQALAPDADSVSVGGNEVVLNDSWFEDDQGEDIRLLRGRDLRYWLLHQLNRDPAATVGVGELDDAIAGAGFRIGGRRSKTISDALATETARGRVVRTGWGTYSLATPLAPTTRKRIARRIKHLRRTLSGRIGEAASRLTSLWRQRLPGFHVDHAIETRYTSSSILIHCYPKVAGPTALPPKQPTDVNTVPLQNPSRGRLGSQPDTSQRRRSVRAMQ